MCSRTLVGAETASLLKCHRSPLLLQTSVSTWTMATFAERLIRSSCSNWPVPTCQSHPLRLLVLCLLLRALQTAAWPVAIGHVSV
ncbi:hypothetical protein FHG87_014913 [Trinorchestia longiramus]|nr:hypothetical protein FHG87_014913 [Trinorchestia longiramus]